MITILHDPAGVMNREDHQHGSIKLLDWLIEKYGPNGFSTPTDIYLNNKKLNLNDHVDDGCPIDKDDSVAIIHRPQGLDPISIFIISAIASATIGLLLVRTPDTPELNQPTESPNNSLSGQTNIARILQRIPDLFGTNKVFPDLLTATYFEFVNHVKIQNEFMCIGRGSFLLEEAKTGNTLLSNIDGTVSTFYEPFNIPAELLNVQESNEVNGQELIGPNQKDVDINSVLVNFTGNNEFKSTNDIITEFENMETGDTFAISTPNPNVVVGVSNISFSGDTITSLLGSFGGFSVNEIIVISGTVSNNISVKAVAVSPASIQCVAVNTGLPVTFVNEPLSSATLDNNVLNAGTFTFDSFSSADIGAGIIEYTVQVQETTFSFPLVSHVNKFLSDTFRSNETGPFNVPGQPDQVWFDIQAPQGIQDDGNYLTISLTLRLQEIDGVGSPIGPPEDTSINLQDNTLDPRFYTFKIIPLNPGGTYEASIFRNTDNSSSGSVVDQTKWTRLAGVEDVTSTDFGDVTTWFVTTRATEQATSVQERKFNVIATRKLRTYDSNTQTMTTTLNASAKVADAVVELLTNSRMGNKPLSQIDLPGLYAIQDELDNDPIYGDKLGRFCYSLSSTRTTVSDELNTALSACRMFRYQLGSMIKFGRDQSNPVRTTLFNRRVKRPDSETKNTRLHRPNDFDGITLEWVNERTGEAGTINFPEGGSPLNPHKIEAAGVKNYEQAWNLAAIEYNKLLFRRTSVKTTVHRDGLLVFPNARVANVDSTTLKTQDGEITATSGTIVETSDPVDFQGNPSATVIIRNESGEARSPMTVTPRLDGVNGFILPTDAQVLDIKVRGDDDNQLGDLYDFAPDGNHLANDYLVQKITPSNDGYVDLELINYSEEIYAPDTITPTPEG